MDHASRENALHLPLGAAYMSEFISPAEEHELVALLDAGEWSTELKRRVQHFGYRYDYKARLVTEDAYLGRLPDWLRALGERLVARGVFEEIPDQVIANEYLPGQGISAHVDCVPCFDDTIVSVSMLSSCEMVFRRQEDGERRTVLLEPGSAMILKSEARYGWTHEIPARKADIFEGRRYERQRRISLTFRKVVRSAG
jgi:alkylated DNA repair dioxygenase AlkB